MIIQHNIPAMNSYRNLNNNQNAIAGNLEKLSSGYQINRAGDNAAGLAVSEKMRSQITGLGAAQNNVADGISLVKTAEGALQEVHDMLNRMTELSTLSANGTFDDDVDRAAYQQEIEQLVEEIDRISDSTNFNGINLLDGSLDSEFADVKSGSSDISTSIIVGGDYFETTTSLTSALVSTDGTSFDFGYVDDNGSFKTASVTYAASTLTTQADALAETFDNFKSAMSDLGWSVVEDGGVIKVTGQTAGFEFGEFIGSVGTTYGGTSQVKAVEDGTKVTFDGVPSVGDNLVVGDYTVVFTDGSGSEASNQWSDNENMIYISIYKDGDGNTGDNLTTSPVEKSKTDLAAELNTALASAGFDTDVAGESVNVYGVETGTPLQLQIGDTSDKFNQLTVDIQSMHTSNLGTWDGAMLTSTIADLDISKQEGASEAIDVIKNAINQVSTNRAGLGAIQNRLEHTANNLSVAEENIQDAESTIRDTDVAEEMMEYTKNNILIQSAQSMLAQANQLPQGVLQLLG